jgi:hypothetical protein
MSEVPPSASGSRLGALLRVRAFRPVPGLLLLVLILPWLPGAAWQPQFTTRRTLSEVELALLITGCGCVSYWSVLLLERVGLLHSSRSMGMREPSEAELSIATALVRFLCLVMVYAGPLLLLRGRD